MHRLPALLLLCAGCVSVQAQPAYDYAHLQREQLGRGFIAVRDEQSDSVVFSWRLLKSDTADVSFNVLKDGKRLNEKEITRSTFFKTIDRDFTSATLSHYTLQCVDGKSHEPSSELHPLTASNPQADYLCIPLDKPSDGFTPDGRRFGYLANDASVGDADGDGEYEVFLKWEPTNAHDNSHDGYTGNVLFDCYRLSGERLWRIDLGRNIRAGAHYTQFMVYDLDGDGRAEVVMKTADGTRDGVGQCIGDSTANYVGQTGRAQGRILEGPEYLSVFDGLTGRNLYTTDYVPPRGNLADWGDTYGNRSERYLACIAYLDGHHPSVVMCRGYYTRTVLAAWDWDGQTLQQRWVFDTDDPRWRGYAGQGNHNLRVADVDADGCDEITYGSMAIDNDGTGLYNTRMGHGDALHLMPFYPDSTTLQVWDVHENRRDGSTLRDARTGRIIFQLKSNTDVGRGMAADIDPTSPGVEMWSSTAVASAMSGAKSLPSGYASPSTLPFGGTATCSVKCLTTNALASTTGRSNSQCPSKFFRPMAGSTTARRAIPACRPTFSATGAKRSSSAQPTVANFASILQPIRRCTAFPVSWKTYPTVSPLPPRMSATTNRPKQAFILENNELPANHRPIL